jgi:hypothetical protein
MLSFSLAACTATKDLGDDDASLTWAAFTQPETVVKQALVMGPGETLSGVIQCDSLLVPAGVEVLVSEDLHLTASGMITIHGTMQAVSRSYPEEYLGLTGMAYSPESAPVPAESLGLLSSRLGSPDIKLQSDTGILVGPSGLILGGHSASYGDHPLLVKADGYCYHAYDLLPGVEAGSITLDSPDTIIDGQIRGGQGGGAGPGGDGGKGGSVVLMGGAAKTADAAHAYIAIGGPGGSTLLASRGPQLVGSSYYPAMTPGRGGAGGDVISLE